MKLHTRLILTLALALSLAPGVAPSAIAQTRTFVTYTSVPFSGATHYNLNDMVVSSSVTYISLVANNIGNTPATSPSDWTAIGGSSGGGSSACPLTNATNLCLTASPYNASGAGATATTTSGTFGVGTSGPVTSCSSFTGGEGVYIAGAGASGANYIGTVVSCAGTTLTVTPATSTSVASGAVVQHDETAAFVAAIAALGAVPGGGTIWGPAGLYLVNGPLTDTGGANAVLAVPKIANYASNLVVISIRGTQPPLTPLAGFVIETAQNTGNFIGGYDSATGGGYPPFTNVFLDLEDVYLMGPGNPGVTMVNASAIIDFTSKNLAIQTVTSALPTNAAGWAIKYPALANGTHLLSDGYLTVAGFYNGVQVGEHLHVITAYFLNYVNAIVADGGTNTGAPSGYQGNTALFDHVWFGPGTNQIVAGANKTPLYITVADLETGTSLAVNDPSNLIYGIVNYNVPFPSDGYNYCTLPKSGGANLQLNPLWCAIGGSGLPAPTLGLMEYWKSQDGTGSTLANSGSDSPNSATGTGVTWGAGVGFTGNVATFDGSTSYATAASAPFTSFDGTTPFSACTWITPSTYAYSASFILSNFYAGEVTGGWGMGMFGSSSAPAGRLLVTMSTASGGRMFMQTSGVVFPTINTNHLACFTYDGSKLAAGVVIYADGSAQTPLVSVDTLAGGSIASTLPLTIGRSDATDGQYFPGAIGRVRIYNRMLSSAELSTMYAAGPNAF
jgi:hypothetical protein